MPISLRAVRDVVGRWRTLKAVMYRIERGHACGVEVRNFPSWRSLSFLPTPRAVELLECPKERRHV
jgi:hypothetical protein